MRTCSIQQVRKRDGRSVAFNQSKITSAIFKAAQAVGGEDRALADELSGVVVLFLEKHYENQVPTIEEIQDMVEKVLIETGHAKTAKAFILYRQERAKVREMLQVRKRMQKADNSTDMSLLVDPASKDEVYHWDKHLISLALQKEADVSAELSDEIAKIGRASWRERV
jgi:ribonucleoside-triphosphate reductase (formate)